MKTRLNCLLRSSFFTPAAMTLTGLTLISSQSAHAATGTWTGTTAGNWSDATKWSSSIVANGAGFNATFNPPASSTVVTTLDSARTVGSITVGIFTTTAFNWTISSATNALTFDNTPNGASSSITMANNAIAPLTIDAAIVLNSNLTINTGGNANDSVTLGTAVGTLSITGSGNISVTSASQNGNGGVTINDNISTTGAIFSSANGNSGGNLTINGVIANGVTGVTQNGSTSGGLTLTGANLYTSATTVGTAGSAASGRTLTVSGLNGSINLSSSYTVNGSGSQLNLDYVGVADGAVDRIGDSTAVTLNRGGELRMNGTTVAATNSSESFGTLTLGAGHGIVSINNGGSGSTDTLTSAGFARGSNFSTALIRGSSLGLSATTGSKLVLTSQTGLTQIGTSTSSAGNDTGTVTNLTIMPYLIGASSGGGVGSNFVTYDTTSGLRRLGDSEQTLVTAAATGDNVRTVVGANAVTGAMVFNSLLLSSGGTGATPGTATSSVTGDGSSLTLTSGALANVATTLSGNATVSGFSSIIFGTTGANEAIIFNTNATAGGDLTIASPINTSAAGGGLTKAGGGNLILSASNLYTGQTTLNQGTLQIGSGTTGDLGSNTAGIVLNGGSLLFARTDAGLTISNVISGPGGVTQNSTGGTTTLSGANTFSGTTTVTSGTLAIGNNLALQNSLLTTTGAGVLTFTGFTTPTIGGLTGAVDLATKFTTGYSSVTNLTLNPGTGVSASYTGVIANGSMSLTKTGAGTQTLSALNTYTGGTNLNAGTLSFTSTGIGTAGAITFTGNSTLTWGASTTTDLSSRLVINNGVTATLNTGSNTVTLATGFGASGSGALTKTGSGTLNLTGTNTYTGGTTISAGIINPTTAGALGSGPVTINFGATLYQISGAITYPNNLILAGGTFRVGGGAGKSVATTGNVTLTANSSLISDGSTSGASLLGTTVNTGGFKLTSFTGGTTNTISAAITGTGGSLDATGGTLQISGANSYTGQTTITSGTLLLGANNVIPDASNVSIAAATLNASTRTDTAGTLAISAAATINLGAGAALAFADSSAVSWSGGTLAITGTFVSGSSLRFGTTSSGLTPTQLALISKPGGGALALNSSGFLIDAPVGGYTSWAATNASSTTPGQDQDNDGVTNAVEYVLGGSVSSNDLSKLPALTTSGGNLLFTFTRAQSSIDGTTAVSIEVGTDLALWPNTYNVGSNTAGSSAGVTVTQNSPSAGTDTITLSVPQAPDAKKFARLKVIVTP